MRCLLRCMSLKMARSGGSLRRGDWSVIGRVIPLFHRRFRMSYFIQIPKAIRLTVNICWALSGQAPVRYTCVQDPSEASLGALFCVSGGSTSSSIPESLSRTNLTFIGCRNGQGAPSATRQRAERVARDLYHVAIDSPRTAALAVICYAKIHGAKHRPLAPLAHGVVDVATHQLSHLPTRSQGRRAMLAKGERYKETGNAFQPKFTLYGQIRQR
jgi:hypothetical protein